MHDIRTIRDDPAAFDASLARRGLAPISAELLALDEARRGAITGSEAALAERNAASKAVGAAKASGNEAEFERLRALVAAKKEELSRLEDEAREADAALRDALLEIPNLPDDDVPDGADEAENVEIKRWGTPRTFAFAAREHYEIAGVIPGMDFETAAKLSGSRFVLLRGAVARIHRALAQFMLDIHAEENGLIEHMTPVLVRDAAMLGTDKLPKFGSELFFGGSFGGRDKQMADVLGDWFTDDDRMRIANGDDISAVLSDVFERAPTHEDFWLIPTSEVTLTYSVSGDVLEEASLPRRMVAHTLCFRSEAGSAGRDTAGLLRQHQFEKVEMVSVTHPDRSRAELDRMTGCAEGILERLGLPYRTIVLCTGDMGFGARRTHDIEVWLPGQEAYREISSCSTTGDFQARRMSARFKPAGGGKPEFVHTLNGSGLAVGRCLIAVLENGQQADGSVTLPEVLGPWLGGKLTLTAEGALV
ncbi:MAG: serine--tRNA ligase [Jannaschia sp.]